MSTFEKPWSKLFDPGDSLAKLLIEKGLLTWAEFMEKLSDERAVYQAMSGLKEKTVYLPKEAPIYNNIIP